MKELKEAIKKAAETSDQSVEAIEKKLMEYLENEYSVDPKIVESRKLDELIKRGKHRILSTLYNSTECKVSEGWGHLSTVPSYRTLLWFIIGQDSVFKGELFNRVVDELLADELIYTRTFAGDKEPKEVGLTKKGIQYWAFENIK